MEHAPDGNAPTDHTAASPATATSERSVSLNSKRVWIALTVTGVLALQAAGTWAGYWAKIRNDQYQLLQVGQCIYRGGTLYVDCWENKPPGIAWINALGVAASGGGQFVAWLLPGVFGVLGIVVLGVAVARTFSAVTACSTALLASAVFSLRIYDATSINPDFYSAVLELSACSLWILAVGGRGWARCVLPGVAAGLLWAGAATVKQTGVLGLLAVTIVATVVSVFPRYRTRRWITSTAFTWFGFLLGIAAVSAVLARARTLGIAVDAVFRFNTGLLSAERIADLFHCWPRMSEWARPVELPLWLGLIGLAAGLLAGNVKRVSSSFLAVMLIWWVAEAAFAMLGPSRSMRYWQATFPAMLWLAAAGIYHVEDVFRRLEKRHHIVPAVVLATALLLLGRPLFDRYVHGLATSYVSFSKDKTERDRLHAVGAQIRTIVPEEERIYVWNYDAGIYVHSRRLSASAFNHPRSAAQMRDILSALKSGRTELLLIPKAGSSHFERWCDDACQRELRDILDDFERIGSINGYDAWIHTSNASPHRSP